MMTVAGLRWQAWAAVPLGVASTQVGDEMWRIKRECFAGIRPDRPLGAVEASAGWREDVLVQACPGAGVEESCGAAGESLLA